MDVIIYVATVIFRAILFVIIINVGHDGTFGADSAFERPLFENLV